MRKPQAQPLGLAAALERMALLLGFVATILSASCQWCSAPCDARSTDAGASSGAGASGGEDGGFFSWLFGGEQKPPPPQVSLLVKAVAHRKNGSSKELVPGMPKTVDETCLDTTPK